MKIKLLLVCAMMICSNVYSAEQSSLQDRFNKALMLIEEMR